ncbi:hypothetical protein [uncultured Fluviicola sp.]|uniref:hypothetical protein n=1 Tax=uncultured Fluviicola sp. TaxID=463303 RepID=UPI0025DBC490|nr:hypothetical protein [uncultured Fluviicola sp.]
MHPLHLPKDKKWRVIRINGIRLKNSKAYYVCKASFQEITQSNPSPKKMASSRYQTIEFNLSQIKFFPLGSVWENDKMIEGVDYFDTFTMKNSELFKSNTSQSSSPDGKYIQDKFHPAVNTNSGNYLFRSSLCIYESQKGFSLTTDGKTYTTQFIAFPCYEIARHFFFSIGIYNSKLLQSNLANSFHNKLFDNDKTLLSRNEQQRDQLHIRLKSGVPYNKYLSVADLASSEKFRDLAMKMQSFLIKEEIDPFEDLQLPISTFKKLSFSAKKVQREDGTWGLLVFAILNCSGYRNFTEVEVDHETPSKKKTADEETEGNTENSNEVIKTINTGTPEDYNEEDLTNNDLDPLIEETSQLMKSFAEDSEIIPYSKVNEEPKANRAKDLIIIETKADERALQTEESDKNSNVHPIQFEEDQKEKIKYDQSQPRDESEDSVMYRDRFFQDFEKIVERISSQLKINYDERFAIRYADENLNFDTDPEKFKLYNMMSGTKPSFLFRNNTKRSRLIYLIEFKIDERYVYLLEPEFESGDSTTTTLTLHKTSHLALSKDEICKFFNVYISAEGVRKRILEDDYIRTHFIIDATDHYIIKTEKTIEKDTLGKEIIVAKNQDMTVREALSKHADKILRKLIKLKI